jgi:hypothetical protein
VGEVLRAAGETIGFSTGQLEIVYITDALVSLTEFAVEWIAKLVRAVIQSKRELEMKQQKAALMMAMLQLISTQEFKKDFKELKKYYGKFIGLMGELTDVFQNFHFASMGQVVGLFLKKGFIVINMIHSMLEAYLWPQCDFTPTSTTTEAPTTYISTSVSVSSTSTWVPSMSTTASSTSTLSAISFELKDLTQGLLPGVLTHALLFCFFASTMLVP